ncbi:hypothetical protein ADIMK_3817 [Marinobacterium lacunae]|uniref:Gamma-glutamylcyclotransferase AIG2-like domain-containing protein n=1 Tax=Marinobacterium lacunae TaxID=1232683 RepID=A0A081FUF1_9GAMM|nr:gamma-glutamylcyclotransferase family protein [Marinobacterium lacunae]KEA62156.1 hypothetical protein ADIMK_3817 [Marinobacterium lacunae]
MHYFAYGSNMSLARLRERVPSAERMGTYWLEGHDLRFHKCGKDGSGKCDAYFTGDPAHRVIGALFLIDPIDKPTLDRAEGLGIGYGQKTVIVKGPQDSEVEALTYWAMLTDPHLKPFSWYLHHVLIGACESALPHSYIEQIRKVEAIHDRNRERDLAERAVHDPTLIIG